MNNVVINFLLFCRIWLSFCKSHHIGQFCMQIGRNALATAIPLVERIVAVDEDAIATAILRLIEVEKVVIEGGGAAGLAAIVQGLVPELEGKPTKTCS